MDGECERLCSCTGHGTVQCTATSCLSHEVCKVKNEVLGCFPSSPATCSVYGDPHYITFDGKAYSFRGTCNYTIATTCTASETQFTVTARNEPQNYSTTLNSVALHVEDLHLVVRKNKLVYVSSVCTITFHPIQFFSFTYKLDLNTVLWVKCSVIHC